MQDTLTRSHFFGIEMSPLAVTIMVVLVIALVVGGLFYGIHRIRQRPPKEVPPARDPHRRR